MILTIDEVEKIIMTGHKGISKTISTALFWHLVKLID